MFNKKNSLIETPDLTANQDMAKPNPEKKSGRRFLLKEQN
jgi:hypothetical protein